MERHHLTPRFVRSSVDSSHLRTICVFAAAAFVGALGSASVAFAEGHPPSFGDLDGRWTPQGPGPISAAQVDVPPNDEAIGAINAVAAHPTDPGLIFVGSVNGGIWRTWNADEDSIQWKHLNADFEAQSVSEIEFDPTDRKGRTLVAGFGATSSLGNLSGPLPGLVITRNKGRRWRSIGREMTGATITGVAPRGRTIVAAARSTRVFDFPLPLGPVDGIWRSTNRGRSFKKISGAGKGLPVSSAFDLVGDPTKPWVLYAGIVFAEDPADNGIYKSVNTGATWTKVSDAALDAAINGTPPGLANLELAVGRHNNIFVSVVGSNNGSAFLGALTALFRSGDGGATWTSLDLPSTQEQFQSFGLHPGFQGAVHNSIAADPSHPKIVYLGGDRQPAFSEPVFSAPFFPNSIGATTFGGRLFLCDASKPAGSQCVHITDCPATGSSSPDCLAPQVAPIPGGGVSNDSQPHADSRHMVFDAQGNLIQVDDGGIYRLNNPADGSGAWTSLNGDMLVNEQHSHAFDPVSAINLAGTQDNGVPYQLVPDDTAQWALFLFGDGGDVAVDTSGFPFIGSGWSARFTSSQFLGNFNQSFWTDTNEFQGFFFLPMTPLDGTLGPLANAQFYTPIRTNAVDDGRLIVAASDGVYESVDAGMTSVRVGPVHALGSGRDPIAYGALDNPDILYVGGGIAGTGNFDEVYVRTGTAGTSLVESTTFPGKGSGLSIRGIAVNPNNSNEAFVINGDDVFQTQDAGATWKVITRNVTRRLATTPFRSILFIPGNGDWYDRGRLIVGASNGAFVTRFRRRGRSRWRRFGGGLPTTQVYELQYDAGSNSVYAGTIANGSWKIRLRN